MKSQKKCWLSEPYLGNIPPAQGPPQTIPSGDMQAVRQGVTYYCIGARLGSSQGSWSKEDDELAKAGEKGAGGLAVPPSFRRQ